MSFWNAMGGAASAIGGVGLQALFSGSQAKKAFKRSVRAYKHRYQWTMADMKAAGLNPILAAKGGLVGSSAAAPMASGISSPDIMGAALKGVSTAKQAKAMQDQLKQISEEAQTSEHVKNRTKKEVEIFTHEERKRFEEAEMADWYRQVMKWSAGREEVQLNMDRIGLSLLQQQWSAAKHIKEMDESEFGKWMRRTQYILDRFFPSRHFGVGIGMHGRIGEDEPYPRRRR